MPKSVNYLKLRTNLRLAVHRLKMLEKKKTELALKARREIADYIGAGKEDRARIRVEHIIREDYLVEAMEIVEMYCDLILARFGLVEKMKEMDPGLEEAIATLFWVAPRLSTDIAELKEISNQLTAKYGKEYAEMCRKNGFENVSEKVLVKMSLYSPPKALIENYMVEIAKAYNVPFVPDLAALEGSSGAVVNDLISLGDDAAASDNMMNEKKDPRGPGFGGGAGPGFGGGAGFGSGGGGGGGMVDPLPPFQPGSSAAHPSEATPPPYTPQGAQSAPGMNHQGLLGPNSQPPPTGASSVPPPLPAAPPNSKHDSPNAKAGAPTDGTNDGAGNDHMTAGAPEGGDDDGFEENPVYDYAKLPLGPAMLQKNLPSYNEATGSLQNVNPTYGLYTIGPNVPPRPGAGARDSPYSDVRPLGPGAFTVDGEGRSQGADPSDHDAPGGGENVYVPVLPDVPDMPSVPGDIQSGKHNSEYDTPAPHQSPPTAANKADDRNQDIYVPVLPEIPHLPSVPTDLDQSTPAPPDDLDFDDLTKRFEALKKKK